MTAVATPAKSSPSFLALRAAYSNQQPASPSFTNSRVRAGRPDAFGRTEVEVWEGKGGQSSTSYDRALRKQGLGNANRKLALAQRYPTLRVTAIEAICE